MAISDTISPNSRKQSQRVWFSNTTASPAANAAKKPSPPAAVPAAKAASTIPTP